jgi:hypothetical protein
MIKSHPVSLCYLQSIITQVLKVSFFSSECPIPKNNFSSKDGLVSIAKVFPNRLVASYWTRYHIVEGAKRIPKNCRKTVSRTFFQISKIICAEWLQMIYQTG